jgi:hypothetical protein
VSALAYAQLQFHYALQEGEVVERNVSEEEAIALESKSSVETGETKSTREDK